MKSACNWLISATCAFDSDRDARHTSSGGISARRGIGDSRQPLPGEMALAVPPALTVHPIESRIPMKLNAVLAAALTLGAALACHAETYTITTDARANSTAGGAGASAQPKALYVTAGETFTVFTQAHQFWHGANKDDSNYKTLTSNADGARSGAFAPTLDGIGSVHVGTLVADIGGSYRVVGAGKHTLTAWATGEVQFHYADINDGDNSGVVVSKVMTGDDQH